MAAKADVACFHHQDLKLGKYTVIKCNLSYVNGGTVHVSSLKSAYNITHLPTIPGLTLGDGNMRVYEEYPNTTLVSSLNSLSQYTSPDTLNMLLHSIANHFLNLTAQRLLYPFKPGGKNIGEFYNKNILMLGICPQDVVAVFPAFQFATTSMRVTSQKLFSQLLLFIDCIKALFYRRASAKDGHACTIPKCRVRGYEHRFLSTELYGYLHNIFSSPDLTIHAFGGLPAIYNALELLQDA